METLFDNPYEPDNFLQRMFESHSGGGCLCAMYESCENCDYASVKERNARRKEVVAEAMKQGYQLWQRSWLSKEYFPLDYTYFLANN